MTSAKKASLKPRKSASVTSSPQHTGGLSPRVSKLGRSPRKKSKIDTDALTKSLTKSSTKSSKASTPKKTKQSASVGSPSITYSPFKTTHSVFDTDNDDNNAMLSSEDEESLVFSDEADDPYASQEHHSLLMPNVPSLWASSAEEPSHEEEDDDEDEEEDDFSQQDAYHDALHPPSDSHHRRHQRHRASPSIARSKTRPPRPLPLARLQLEYYPHQQQSSSHGASFSSSPPSPSLLLSPAASSSPPSPGLSPPISSLSGSPTRAPSHRDTDTALPVFSTADVVRFTQLSQSLDDFLHRQPAVRQWCRYEWFYSHVDKYLFQEHHQTASQCFPSEPLTAAQLRDLRRRTMTRPRRFSARFIASERDAWVRRRQLYDALQDGQGRPENDPAWPDEVPLRLRVGQRVSVWMRDRRASSTLRDGMVFSVDRVGGRYEILMDHEHRGRHGNERMWFPEAQVMSHGPDFLLQCEPHNTVTNVEEAATAVNERQVEAAMPWTARGTMQKRDVIRRVVWLSRALSLKYDIVRELELMNWEVERKTAETMMQQQQGTWMVDPVMKQRYRRWMQDSESLSRAILTTLMELRQLLQEDSQTRDDKVVEEGEDKDKKEKEKEENERGVSEREVNEFVKRRYFDKFDAESKANEMVDRTVKMIGEQGGHHPGEGESTRSAQEIFQKLDASVQRDIEATRRNAQQLMKEAVTVLLDVRSVLERAHSAEETQFLLDLSYDQLVSYCHGTQSDGLYDLRQSLLDVYYRIFRTTARQSILDVVVENDQQLNDRKESGDVMPSHMQS